MGKSSQTLIYVMEKSEYDKYVSDWEAWNKRHQDYLRIKTLVLREFKNDPEKQDEMLKKLEKDYGKEPLSGWDWEGPTVIIRDPGDLRDPKFILPGLGINFTATTLDQGIPGYYGKTIVEISAEESDGGVLLGLAYDYWDWYFLVQHKELGEVLMNYNTAWKVVDNKGGD